MCTPSIKKLLTRIGIKYKDFSIPFSLATVSTTKNLVAREKELTDIHKSLSGDGSRYTVIVKA